MALREYYTISLLDVNEQISFSWKRDGGIEEDLDKQKQQREEFQTFLYHLEQNLGEAVIELKRGLTSFTHYRSYLLGDLGFFELSLKPPIAMNFYFSSKRSARKALRGLRKSLKFCLPKGVETEVFLSTLEVTVHSATGKREDGKEIEGKDLEMISRFRKLWEKSFNVLLFSLMLFIVIEFIKAILTMIFSQVFHINTLILISIVSIVTAFFFKPLENFTRKFVFKLDKGI